MAQNQGRSTGGAGVEFGKRTKRTAIVLVHGVGDPKPGDTLRDFTAALDNDGSRRVTLRGPTTVHEIEDRSYPETSLRRFFPAHMRSGSIDGRDVVFAEVFWGAASTLPHGVVGVIRGLFELIFGLDAIIRGNPDRHRTNIFDRVSTIVARVGSEALRGPVAAFNVLLLTAVLFLVLIATSSGNDFSDWTSVPYEWPWWLVVPVTSSLVMLLGGVLLWRIWKESAFDGYQRFRPQRSFGWSCVLVAGFWPAYGWITSSATWQRWAEIAFDGLLLCFGLVCICLIIVSVIYLGVRLARCSREMKRAISARTLALALQFGLWGLVVPSFWLIVLSYTGEGIEAGSSAWLSGFQKAVPSDGLQWIGVPFVILAIFITWLWRRLAFYRISRRWSAASGACVGSHGIPTPRMLVGASIEWTVILLSLYGGLASLSIYLADNIDWYGLSLIPAAWLEAIQTSELYLIPTAALVLTLSFIASNIRIALDVGTDVIQYVRLNVAEGETGRVSGLSDRREWMRPIRGKFNEVLRFLDRTGGFDKLVVIAHSQGTVLVLDELAHSNFGRERDWLRNLDVRLVTMGSPMAHLYQHYFPSAYPRWQHRYWKELPRRLNQWLNLYRIDDFVGTTMEITDPSDIQRLNFSEECVGMGQHSNYWRDRRVIERLLATDIM